MWIATTCGWYSIVQRDADFQVRARSVSDLEELLALTRLRVPIVKGGGTDYLCRIIVTPAQLALVMRALTKAIDYPNFKSAVARRPTQRAKLSAYHDIWAIMARRW